MKKLLGLIDEVFGEDYDYHVRFYSDFSGAIVCDNKNEEIFMFDNKKSLKKYLNKKLYKKSLK